MKTAAANLSFDDLYALKQFSAQLRERHIASLAKFGDKTSSGFKQKQSRPDQQELSMSSTATCVGSLVGAGLWKHSADPNWLKDYSWLEKPPFWANQEAAYVQKLLTQEWTSAGLPPDNAFTTAFVVEACSWLIPELGAEFATLKNISAQKLQQKIPNGTDRVLNPMRIEELLDLADSLLWKALFGEREPNDDTPKGSIAVLDYPPNAYLTQLGVRSLLRLRTLPGPWQKPDRDIDRSAVSTWALGEITRQVALIKAGSRASDPLHMAYAIVCAVKYRRPEERTPPDNELIRFALRAFFDAQLDNGGWPQSNPLFHYPRAGSAYCYDYELLAELMDCAEIYDMLFEFLPKISKATYALDLTKFELGDGAYSWASNQTPQLPGPESWSTACVFLFLYRLDRFLAEAIRQVIALELEVRYAGVRTPQQAEFGAAFLDCPLTAADDETTSLKSSISGLLVEPLRKAKHQVENGHKLPKSARVSAILFGPPGTSKTEIVDQIAQFVGWPAVTIDPSYFVKNGLDQIQAQANRIFRMLAAAEQMIVLFDEFDEMVRNRADSNEIFSRFLTTAMLPKLSTINKERRILFIVATNYIRSFDIAISRPGRFDLIFQMMPPKAQEKLQHAPWKADLEWLKGVVGGGADAFDIALGQLTYMETGKLVARIQELGRDPKDRDKPTAQTFWAAALETCTLRRAHEQFPRTAKKEERPFASPKVAEKLKKIEAACKEWSPNFLTWLEVALLESQQVRLQ